MLCIFLYFFMIRCCLTELWTIYVYTGNERFAGTDTDVYISLFNSKDETTGEYRLTHSNWIPDTNRFGFRNLFEAGAEERFRIRTKNIGSVAKIQVRRSNFPFLQADWLLDRVMVERDHDGAKYTFLCNCWLEQAQPHVKILALSDVKSLDENETEGLSSATRTVIIIFVMLIIIMLSIFCYYNEYCRRRAHAIRLQDQIELARQQGPLNIYCIQIENPPTPLTQSQSQVNSNINRVRNELQQSQSTVFPAITSMILTDQLPSYEDLYPNSIPPTNEQM